MIPKAKAAGSTPQIPRIPPLPRFWYPYVILVMSLSATVLTWWFIDLGITDRAEQLFQNKAEEIARRTVNRLSDNEEILLGGNALFNVKGQELTRQDWQQYVAALKLEATNPGILGFGFSTWLHPAEKEVHIRRVRAEGFPAYSISPAGERPAYTAIIWLEPFNAVNQRAFGYDMYSEPVRRAAMARARDTGMTSITTRVLLVQETEQTRQSGLLMYIPSYRRGLPTATVEQRRAALRGFVYSPIRINDLVYSTFGQLPAEIDFELHAGTTASADALLFSSRLAETRPLPNGYRPAFASSTTVEAFGVPWHFTFSSRPDFDAGINRGNSQATLVAGVVASLLLTLLAFMQVHSRRQAVVIAEQMAQQLAVRQKQELHVEQTPLAVIEWDEQFRVTAWNPAAEKIFGYPAAEAIGRHAAFIVPESDRIAVDRVLADLLANRGGSTSTNRNVTRDGNVIECDWYNTPLVDKHEAVVGVASLAQDITERALAEARIQETMQRLRLATEAADIGIWSWNFADDRLEWDDRMNAWYEIPAAMRQAGPSFEFWRSRLHADDVDRAETELRKARLSNIRWDSEFRIVLPGGRLRYLHANAVIERDRYGQPLRMVGINRDITRDRQIEEVLRNAKQDAELARIAAEQANRAKSDFLATMSHEIRTPMTVFIGAVEQLDHIDSDPAHRKLLDLAIKASQRLLALIDDILDLSRIEAQRVELAADWFNLRKSLQETIKLLAATAREKNLRLELQVAADSPEQILGDQYRFEQVLINLVGNAIKFTDEGLVQLAVRRLDGTLEFTVTDTGIGIPADKLDHIFGTFSQVDSSSTRRHGGTGLGLAICKRLVEMMGGTISVCSCPGEGSVFTFTLPIERVNSPATKISAAPPA
jgi:PAS domain S-box-containing protein